MEIVGIIPARAGSKSIKRKNLAPLAGKPLIQYTINAAKRSLLLSRVIVTTDDPDVATLARKNGISVIIQPPEISQDNTPMAPVIQNAVKVLREKARINPDMMVILQPTSPLRTSQTIDACIQKMLEMKADSVTTVSELPHGANYSTELKENGKTSFSLKKKASIRQKMKKKYCLNGAVFCITVKELLKQDRFVLTERNNYATVISYEEAIDIDTPLDLKIAEVILNERNKARR